MRVRFWGTRGSVPAPGALTTRYGGNTSCVEVLSDDGTRIILDCGTGARELGQHILSAGTTGGLRLHLFIGHTHWDHIQGFPFFVPAFLPDAEMNIYAAAGFQRSLEETLAGQMQYSYFPVKLRELRSRIHFTELEEGFFRVGDILVETQHLNHTAPTIAYRITADGATVAYTTDHEPFWWNRGLDFRHPGDQRHIEFLQGADLVIHDAQYTEAEYPERVGWGHSTIEYATDVAIAAGVRRLALFHHDPYRKDDEVDRLELDARRRADDRGSSLDVFAASEGRIIEMRGEGRVPDVPELSALRHHPIAGKKVLVLSASEPDLALLSSELEEDNLMVLKARNKGVALEIVEQTKPDLVIVDAETPSGDGFASIAPLRERAGGRVLPVLLLTGDPYPYRSSEDLGADVTDYLAKPPNLPMLRARVRAWLARASNSTTIRPAGRPATVLSDRAEPTLERITDLIASVPVFGSLTQEQLRLVAANARLESFEAGQRIVHQGDVSDSLYILLSGRVRVSEPTEDPGPGEVVLSELGPGQVFGEMGVLVERARSATVVAVEATRCVALPAFDLVRVLQDAPEVALALLRVLSDRIYETDRRLARYAPDPLTGLPSRRAFHDQYARLVAQARRRGTRVMLLLLDVRNLKVINDHLGYEIGDEVLRTVADALMESARKADLVARYGGDEFVALLVDANEHALQAITERLRAKLAELAPKRGLNIPIECAIGVAMAERPPEAVDDLLIMADQDMQKRRATTASP